MREDLVRSLWNWWYRHTCEHWQINLAMSFVAAFISAFALRWSIGFWFAFLPTDTWASELLITAIGMSARDFWLTMAVSAFGGVASFMHEVRGDSSNLKIINAIGHMFSAQFAGLMMYLLAVEWGISSAYGIAMCGIAGWGGNKTIQLLSDKLLAKVGIEQGKDRL